MKQFNGKEQFTLHDAGISLSVNDFWRWAYSDLLNNTSRGVLSEFIVASSFESTPPHFANAYRLASF